MRELPELFALVYDDANSNNVAQVCRCSSRHSWFIDDTFPRPVWVTCHAGSGCIGVGPSGDERFRRTVCADSI